MELLLFFVGGRLYTWVELLWRGRTHWTMFILGGICFVILGLLNEHKIPWHWCLLRQTLVGTCIITVFEFVSGCIINLWLRWQVWDYSGLPFNLFGQVCLYYIILWIPLSTACIVIDDWLRYWFYLKLHKWVPRMQPRQRPYYRLI